MDTTGVDEPVEGLGGSPLFAALDPQAQAELRAQMLEVRLARGQALFDEGEPGDRLYVVTSGKVKLGRTAVDGRENLLAVMGPGEMFGELSLFDPGPRTATATAVTDTTLIGLGNADLQPWLTAHPEVADPAAGRAGPAAAADQRGDGRPGLQRRARAGSPRRCSTWPGGSAYRPRTGSGSPTTSPRRSSPSWSAPPARPSTRRSPTSPAAASCASRAAPWSSSTSSASPAAPATADRRPAVRRLTSGCRHAVGDGVSTAGVATI